MNQIKLPPYKRDVFDCTDTSSIVEWLLEGAGFKATLASNSELGEWVLNSHMWVLVRLDNGRNVAIEATYLSEDSNYYPPGIIEAPNGDFEYYSFKSYYDRRHPNRYLLDSPKKFNYYSPVSTYNSPQTPIEGKIVEGTRHYMKESEFDWWNVAPYIDIKPFSKWN